MSTSNAVHVDLAKIDDLRALERPGSEGFLARILSVFLSDAGKRLDEIRRAFEREDFEALAMGAHALKGSAFYVGAHRLAEMCRQLEQLAEQKAASPDIVAGLRQELDAVRAVLQAEIESNGEGGGA